MNKEKMKKEIGKMLDQMEQGSEDIKDSMNETIEEAKNKIKEARYNANRYILENPERSVLMSAAAGAAIGIVLAMLMKKKGHCKHF